MKKKAIITVSIIAFCWLVITTALLISLPKTGNKKTFALDKKETQTIKLKGAVAFPGTYTISPGDDLGKIITYAQGFTDDADLSNIDLNYVIKPTDREIEIPKKELENDNKGIQKVNLNNATFDAIKNLNILSDTKINAILDYRNSNKRFNRIEDLLKVRGIGTKTFNEIKDYFTI